MFDWHHAIRDAVLEPAPAKGVAVDAARFANDWRTRMLGMVGQVRSGALP